MDCDPKSHRHRRWLSCTGEVIWKRFLCFTAVLRGKRGLSVSQVTLRSLTDDGLMRFALWGTIGALIRETRIGALSSACGRRARFANAQALLAISDFHHAESRTAGA